MKRNDIKIGDRIEVIIRGEVTGGGLGGQLTLGDDVHLTDDLLHHKLVTTRKLPKPKPKPGDVIHAGLVSNIQWKRGSIIRRRNDGFDGFEYVLLASGVWLSIATGESFTFHDLQLGHFEVVRVA